LIHSRQKTPDEKLHLVDTSQKIILVIYLWFSDGTNINLYHEVYDAFQ